jgi:hypothetical protein
MPLAPPPGDELAATTMDLGGPFPPAPPPVRHRDGGLSSTGSLPAFGGGGVGGVSGADGGPAVPPPGPEPRRVADEEPEERAAEPRGEPAAPGRGRSRLKLLVIAVVGVAVIAYGAGLLLNSDDVPKGTTVLGIDIGGTTSQEAVNRLDSALDRANDEPLPLLIGEEEAELSPSVAGLEVDTEATVRAVSGQDYSPVTVIGSLFGAERTEEAVFAVDRDKLTTALEEVAARHEGAGAPVEGGITFEEGQAIGHPGEPGSAIDVPRAADAVEAAFRERAATGRDPAIELPIATQDPLVDAAEVDRALEEFAEPAMSGWVWVVAGDAEPLPFSPETLSRLLTMEPSEEGNLQPVMDTEGLADAYGTRFDGVMIDAGAGPVELTPEHVAAAMIPVLHETATTDALEGGRVATVEGAFTP